MEMFKKRLTPQQKADAKVQKIRAKVQKKQAKLQAEENANNSLLQKLQPEISAVSAMNSRLASMESTITSLPVYCGDYWRYVPLYAVQCRRQGIDNACPQIRRKGAIGSFF